MSPISSPISTRPERPLNVWLLQTGEILPLSPGAKRLRTALLAERLARRGHRVLWWASAFNHLRKSWEFDSDAVIRTDGGVTIRALKGAGYSRNFSPMRWLDYRRVAAKFRAAAPKEAPPDVIVASMPGYDLAAEAVAYARARSIPILVDIRDQWPESFVDPLPSWLRPLGSVALSGETRLMKRALSGADSLVSMSQEILDWGLIQAGRGATPSDLVFPLGGRSPETGARPCSPSLSRALRRAEGKLVIVFIGTFARYHNPSALVECARVLAGSGIHFIIAGDGPLRAGLVAAANDSADIDFPGWLDQIDIDALLSRAAVGACTTDPDMVRPFFPNKVFSYMAAGLPVLSAFRGEMRRLVESERIGFHFESVEELASALRRLHAEPELRADMGKRALQVFRGRFDSDGIYERYADHVESVAARRGTHAPG